MSLTYSLDPVFEKIFCARTVKDYELTLGDIDNSVSGWSSEYVLVRLADIGKSQMELLFEDDLIARPDLMTGSHFHRMKFHGAVSTKKAPVAKIIVEFKDTKSFERLKPDSKGFKSYNRQLLYYLVISEYDAHTLY
jgi:hypothetical protein